MICNVVIRSTLQAHLLIHTQSDNQQTFSLSLVMNIKQSLAKYNNDTIYQEYTKSIFAGRDFQSAIIITMTFYRQSFIIPSRPLDSIILTGSSTPLRSKTASCELASGAVTPLYSRTGSCACRVASGVGTFES